MVVDDSHSAVRAICSMLGRNPEVELVGTANDGCEALKLADSLHPELVLLDFQMPVMNGIETAEEMSRKFPDTRIIMVTVHDSLTLRDACCRAGAHAFISKERLNEEFPGVLHQLFDFAR